MDLIFVFILVCAYCIYFLIERKNKFQVFIKNRINGPKPNLFWGNLKELKTNNLITFQEWSEKYGKIYGFFLGQEPQLVVQDEELIRLIAIKDFHLFSNRFVHAGDYEFVNDVREKKNVALINGKDWKRHRTIIRSSFSSSKLKAMVPLIEDSVKTLIKIIGEKSVNNNEFDIHKLYKKLTMEVIGKVAFGIDTESQTNPNDEFATTAESVLMNKIPFILMLRFLAKTLSDIVNLFHYALSKARLLPQSKIFELSENIIKNRIKTNVKRKDLLQLMIDTEVPADLYADHQELSVNVNVKTDDKIDESKKDVTKQSNQPLVKMNTDEIVSNCFAFLLAGFETTSTALGFITHFLVNHLDVQSRVREEVKDLLSKEGKLDYNTVSKLPYMEAVINESLRMYPPVTLFMRRFALIDYKYKDITIPKKTQVIFPIPLIHRDEAHWPNPDVFNPDRFLDDTKNKANSCMFMPFGAGPRNCIGLRLAMLEIKLTLSNLLSKYELVPSPNTFIDELPIDHYRSLQRPKKGVIVKVVAID